ncbi:hypothetical protein C8J57DRAFT_1333593 [Mycena rebaudengoi]|nr:hypothetical protein C8J57DRAFT_1333593 [Mycena rebaudengoi]
MHRTRLHARLALLLTSCMDDGVLCTNCPRCYSGGYKAAKRAVDRKSRRRRLYVPSPNPLRTSSRMSPAGVLDTAVVTRWVSRGEGKRRNQ